MVTWQQNQSVQFHPPTSPWQLRRPGPGALVLGGDVSTNWTGPAFGAFVSRAQATGSNRIMVVTAGYGSPSSKDLEAPAVNDFLQGSGRLAPGLGIIGNASFEPRLTVDYRWGRLYALIQAHPNQLAVGIADAAGIVLDGSGAHAAGDLSVVSLDGRWATFGTGSNGALSAYNVLLDAFAPGATVSG